VGKELEKALDALPHGPEFRFLDRLIALERGQHGVSEYTVRGDENFLRGHFPGKPLMPGVLLVEAAAQLAGVVAQSDLTIEPLHSLKLTALRAVKILGSASPGEVVIFDAHVTGRLGNLVQVRATAAVSGKKILEAELTLGGEAQDKDG
jgi:3-hydroxyacyl-[acyl-carrier-protein] dehydratase